MSHLTRRLVEGLAEAYTRKHPEPATEEKPSAEEVEQAGIDALRRALYGSPPTATHEENHD